MNHHPAIAAIIERECIIAQQELDAAQLEVDKIADLHQRAMRRLQEARARVTATRALKHEPYVGDAC
jgi:hypothetical protein